MRDRLGIPASERVHDWPRSLDLKTANASSAAAKLVSVAARRTVAVLTKIEDVMERRFWMANEQSEP
jgi:hypothetical protein